MTNPRTLSRFDVFAAQCAKSKLVAVACSETHWQIRGGALLVNFYPTAKRGPCYYVAGTSSGFYGNAEAAIAAASTPPREAPQHERIQRRATYRAAKRRMLKRHPHCNWCGVALREETATIDHVVPLARGGLDNANNWVLACAPCNHGRGSAMPEVRRG